MCRSPCDTWHTNYKLQQPLSLLLDYMLVSAMKVIRGVQYLHCLTGGMYALICDLRRVCYFFNLTHVLHPRPPNQKILG